MKEKISVLGKASNSMVSEKQHNYESQKEAPILYQSDKEESNTRAERDSSDYIRRKEEHGKWLFCAPL